ncbi:hypothetical protein AMJ87_02430 [candidate division WOR_3 bacterium SM23_60]|uniref:Uncharacterized protein n=1 Tax=candidate division WOR_3 bacterium SM23_60 TaxID=1703780 RepID=A0A0S8GN00_UNCW3|nr:MAG: hypothetical protein AMJ87_02430 [candidate division WOR_3 bacterium SM23_60]
MESELEKKGEPLPDFDALWDFQHPEQTETKFQELIPQAKESGNMSYYAQLLTQIGRTRGLQGKYQDAHAMLDSVEAMLTDELTVAKIRYLLERGRVYNSSGEPDKCKPFFLEAWELALTKNEDYYAVDAAHMLGIVEPPEKQLEWSLKALELAEKTTDERAQRWLGPLYNNIGWTYHDLKEYEKALELFKKGLAWRKEIDDARGIRIQTWNIARTYRSLGKVTEALEMQRALEKEIEGIEFDFEGYVFEEIAECMLLLKKNEEAKPYFKRAHEVLSKDQWLAKNEPERLERLKDLSE